MKKILFTLCLLAACTAIKAAKAHSILTSVRQSDGTTLQVRLMGDENLSWSTTSDGVLLFQKGNDFFIAQVDECGDVTSTGILAHEAAERGAEEIAAAKKQNRQLFFETAEAKVNNINEAKMVSLGSATPNYFPHTGSPKILVVLVNFSDTTFCLKDPVASFDDYFNYMDEGRLPARGNKEERNRMSVAKYFKKSSDGQFVPKFIVKGPVTVSQSQAYYGSDTGGTDANISKLLKEALDSIAPQVDFTEFDNDGDGYVDAVMFVHAGYEQSISGNSSDCIWAKASTVSISTTYNNKKVYRYCIIGERRATPTTFANQMNGIGICCHEFSHCLGLPDLYPTVTSAQLNNQAMEDWDLMDGGEYMVSGFFPTPYNPWEKELLGWTTLKEISEPQLVTLAPDSAVRVSADDGKQYVILHNMQLEDSVAYERYNHGLLIHRIDMRTYSTISISSRPNNTVGMPKVSIVPADSLLITIYKVSDNDPAPEGYHTADEYLASYKGDVYPGTSNVTRVDSITLNDDVIVSKPLYNIREEAGEGEYPNVVFAFIDESVDGIKEVSSTAIDDKSIYDLNGVKLGDALPQKGIYIKGGKKYVVK